MKNPIYRTGLALIALGFLISAFSPYYVIFGFPVFLVGAIIVASSNKRFKVKFLIILIPLILWFPTTYLWLYTLGTFFNKSTPQTILIPENYQGRFIIVYGEKCGIQPKIENGRQVLEIPKNGILVIQSQFKAGDVDDEYYLIDSNRHRKQIQTLLNYRNKSKEHPAVLLISSGTGGGKIGEPDISWVDYQVYNRDTTEEKYSKHEQLDSIMNVLVDNCRGRTH